MKTIPTTLLPQRLCAPAARSPLVSWESLGHQGRNFVAGGPTVDGALRVYRRAPASNRFAPTPGWNSADGIKATATLAAEELQRTGGLDRDGRAPWPPPPAPAGSTRPRRPRWSTCTTATPRSVSMQYSFLPSWISFLVDQENARQAGQALFEAVDALVRATARSRPPEAGGVRGEPRLVRRRDPVSGPEQPDRPHRRCAVPPGPRSQNTIWTNLTINRDAGSPQWLPIFDEGENVRFSAKASQDLGRPDDPWGQPRVVYCSTPSDPIAWWNPDLLFAKPDWLREPRGYDVSPRMEWIPVVTFLQVSADMAVAVDVPDGHGHVYVRDVANAWAAILQPPGWTPAKTERLRPVLRSDE